MSDWHQLMTEFRALGDDVADALRDVARDPEPLLARREAILTELVSLTSTLDAPRAPLAPLADAVAGAIAQTDALRSEAASRRDALREELRASGTVQRAADAYGAAARLGGSAS